MRAENRVVAGLSCFEVLARLSDALDGELPAAERVQVEAHLAGCDACTRFGGEFAEVVAGLRERLGQGGDAPGEVVARLERRLGQG